MAIRRFLFTSLPALGLAAIGSLAGFWVALSERSQAAGGPAGAASNEVTVASASAREAVAAQETKKPNILVIFGDDIGQTNISAYSMGLMGYRTPNIDRIAREGMIFTDYYAEQSCTAGRSSFITGQCTFRTGLSKVGVPAATVGLKKEDPTIAELLKPLGYATGQFGKNHLGDRNEYLPTVHGFDEFFGNLYHLNAEEEPEQRTYPRDPEFKRLFGPRGVLRCKASEQDDPTVDPRFGPVGKQVIEDTGPLTKKRMETIDDDTSDAAVDYIKRQNEIVSGHDWLPTLLAAAGVPEIKEKLLKGHEAGGTTFKVHLDGFNQLPYLTGQVEKSPRKGFFYFNDDADLVALRFENWKVVFMEQRAAGTLRVWAEPFTTLRLPKLFDLRADPYERADVTSNTYYDWVLSQPYLFFAAQAATVKFLETFKEFPPRQRAASFSIDQAIDQMKKSISAN